MQEPRPQSRPPHSRQGQGRIGDTRGRRPRRCPARVRRTANLCDAFLCLRLCTPPQLFFHVARLSWCCGRCSQRGGLASPDAAVAFFFWLYVRTYQPHVGEWCLLYRVTLFGWSLPPNKHVACEHWQQRWSESHGAAGGAIRCIPVSTCFALGRVPSALDHAESYLHRYPVLHPRKNSSRCATDRETVSAPAQSVLAGAMRPPEWYSACHHTHLQLRTTRGGKCTPGACRLRSLSVPSDREA